MYSHHSTVLAIGRQQIQRSASVICVRTVFDFWIVGPSAMGSVNGMPSSIISVHIEISDSGYIFDSKLHPIAINCLPAPPASIASIMSGVSSGVGYPAVT
jgi:hypothetical protein